MMSANGDITVISGSMVASHAGPNGQTSTVVLGPGDQYNPPPARSPISRRRNCARRRESPYLLITPGTGNHFRSRATGPSLHLANPWQLGKPRHWVVALVIHGGWQHAGGGEVLLSRRRDFSEPEQPLSCPGFSFNPKAVKFKPPKRSPVLLALAVLAFVCGLRLAGWISSSGSSG